MTKAAEADSTTGESTLDGSAPLSNAEASEADHAANEQLTKLQRDAVASAVNGGEPVSSDAFGSQLLRVGTYTYSRAKRFLDLAYASYNRAATHNGQSWQHIDVSGAESEYNLCMIGKALSDSERNSVKPPPPIDAAVVVEVCFRGSVFVGEEGGVNFDNWCSVNLNPDRTPLDKQIGEASPLDGAHVHAGFQSAYLAARGPLLKWLNEKRKHPDQRLHVSCCGHSLGAALATLLAFDLRSTGRDSVELVTWASPRVGDKAFCKAFAELVPSVARFTCGADVVPRLPPEMLGFDHVCSETRLDAWVTMATEGLGSHSLDVHAQALEYCFRDPLTVVRIFEGGWCLTKKYAPLFLAGAASTGLGPSAGAWFCVNLMVNNAVKTVEDQIRRDVGQMQLQLKKLQESVDSISEGLVRTLEEQAVKNIIGTLQSKVDTLVASNELPGEVLHFQGLRETQQELLLELGKVMRPGDSRSKHGPQMLNLLLISYATELKLLSGRTSRTEQIPVRSKHIDQRVRSIFPDIEAAIRSGSFSRKECPALDCLLPQLLIGAPLRIPRAKLFVNTQTGKKLAVDFDPSDSVYEIKEKIQDLEGILPDHQSLISADTWLNDSQCLCQLPQFMSTLTLHMMVNLHVESAFYGEPWGQAKRRGKDVTFMVRSLVRNNVLEVNKGGAAGGMNRLFGDPCSFVTKILEVSFRYGGGPLVTTSTLGETDPLVITFNKYTEACAGWEQKVCSTLGEKAMAAKLLNLSWRWLGSEGTKVVAHVMKVSAVLTTLDLSGNDIRDEGAVAIAEVLRVNGVLKILDLERNKIGDEGAKAIGGALAVNGVLKSLNLYRNHIGDTGAIAIAEALRGNGVLKRIVLYNNELGDEGEKAIRDAVSEREGFELMM